MKKFWNWIKNSDDTRILRLEGPIDEESFWGDEITPQMFRDELESGEGDVTVWINSPGGNVFAAAEIYTMLTLKRLACQQKTPCKARLTHEIEQSHMTSIMVPKK